jgi:hypothetical protein
MHQSKELQGSKQMYLPDLRHLGPQRGRLTGGRDDRPLATSQEKKPPELAATNHAPDGCHQDPTGLEQLPCVKIKPQNGLSLPPSPDGGPGASPAIPAHDPHSALRKAVKPSWAHFRRSVWRRKSRINLMIQLKTPV